MGTNISSEARDDVQLVLDGIRRIVQGLRESSRRGERQTGLTAAQLFVLRRLAEGDGLSINEVAARTFTHQSSVSVVVSRLVRRQLVRRRPDERDRRRRVLTLTAAGRRALETAPGLAQERLIAGVLAMAPSARRALGRALTTMADGMSVERRPAMFFEERARP